MTKVAVAMSGGVDSSVAAALAVEKYGRENVFGVTMKLFCYSELETRNSKLDNKSCCSLDAINDAAAVCKQLGIPHYVVNLEKEFEKEIIGDFVSEYGLGRTPNPCVRCNSIIKFGYLLEKARGLGADLLVTGHYARIAPSRVIPAKAGIQENVGELDSWPLTRNDNVLGLFRGLDAAKDQSYFLYKLDQRQLAHIWFPLGELTKAETRKIAEEHDLKTAKKTESQDICFVTTTTQEFLAEKIKAEPGDIVDKDGRVLGKHEGLPFYTIGQRKGLGGGFAEPMYVIGLDLDKNELVVGREEELYDDEMLVGDVTWTNEAPSFPAELDVKIRYNSQPSVATLSSLSVAKDPEIIHSVQNDGLKIAFHAPQKAITPGQTAVLYRDDEVVGGGTILSTRQP